MGRGPYSSAPMGDAVNDVGAVSHFKIILDKLYSLYSCSPKNRAELEVAAADVSEQVRKIGRVLDTRWVSSSFNTNSSSREL